MERCASSMLCIVLRIVVKYEVFNTMVDKIPYADLKARLDVHELTNRNYDRDDGATYVRVPNDKIGQFYREVRQLDAEHQAKRLGDTLVARIETKEPEGLNSLFG